MTTRTVTLLGYSAVALAGLALELRARLAGRGPTFAQAVAALCRRWPVRALLLFGWLWLGWHLFVRVDWH
jgi:Family of unknown function (DUF6186)